MRQSIVFILLFGSTAAFGQSNRGVKDKALRPSSVTEKTTARPATSDIFDPVLRNNEHSLIQRGGAWRGYTLRTGAKGGC